MVRLEHQKLGDPVFRLDQHIQGINVPDADLYMPIEEAKSRLHDPRFVIPYSRAVKEQMLDGKLTEPVNDRRFNDKFKAIVDKIVGYFVYFVPVSAVPFMYSV